MAARDQIAAAQVRQRVIHDNHLFLSDADGFVECLDANTGNQVWKERLPGKMWGSLLLADDRLYVTSLEGATFVLAAKPKFELLATNEVGEATTRRPCRTASSSCGPTSISIASRKRSDVMLRPLETDILHTAIPLAVGLLASLSVA